MLYLPRLYVCSCIKLRAQNFFPCIIQYYRSRVLQMLYLRTLCTLIVYCASNSVLKTFFFQFYPSLTETPHEALLAKLQRAETGELVSFKCIYLSSLQGQKWHEFHDQKMSSMYLCSQVYTWKLLHAKDSFSFSPLSLSHTHTHTHTHTHKHSFSTSVTIFLLHKWKCQRHHRCRSLSVASKNPSILGHNKLV